MDDGQQLYITRPAEGEDLYTSLQRQTLAELQRLSGNVWTDYNPSDPGVTVAEAADYALTEIDYKLGFPLEDYLAGKDGTWAEQKYGFFPSESVYPSAPVTVEDYRRAVLTRFPEVENVDIIPENDGVYSVRLRISPFATDVSGRVLAFLNRHRNLCERFAGVQVISPEKLSLHADFEIATGADATDILVQVYWTALHYLSGAAELTRLAEGVAMREDEWYDGPVKTIRAEIPELKNTETELYVSLTKIPGIVSFKTCYLRDTAGHVVTDFKAGYTLELSKNLENINVRAGNEAVQVDGNEVIERLKAKYFMRGTFRTRRLMRDWDSGGRGSSVASEEGNGRHEASEAGSHEDRMASEVRNGNSMAPEAGKTTLYRSEFRDVYGHTPLADDLPGCYATSERDFSRDMPAGEKADARNFGNYLKLYDLLMQRGLNELAGLKRILALDTADGDLTFLETLPEETLSMRKHNDRYRDIEGLRTQYMDFIDGLYGVSSAPDWINEFDCYGLSAGDRLRRRMRFLRALPEMVRDRCRSFDIAGEFGGANVPVVKKYLSLLLDFDMDEETSVGNILPAHNLILMGDGERGERFRGLISSQMIDDEVFNAGAVEAIEEDIPPASNEEKLERYEELRRHLPIFNSNWITGSLFREGISLGNYNIVSAGNGEWLLVFRGKEEERRMNLGRSDDKAVLCAWANTLCRYLRELNRQSETVYVVEKSLFEPAEPFTVMLVFTGWTARTHSARFREECARLARSVIPSHLKVETFWIGALQMQYFEAGYKKWRESMRTNASTEVRALCQKRMMDALSDDFMVRRRGPGENRDNGNEDGV